MLVLSNGSDDNLPRMVLEWNMFPVLWISCHAARLKYVFHAFQGHRPTQTHEKGYSLWCWPPALELTCTYSRMLSSHPSQGAPPPFSPFGGFPAWEYGHFLTWFGEDAKDCCTRRRRCFKKSSKSSCLPRYNPRAVRTGGSHGDPQRHIFDFVLTQRHQFKSITI